MSSNGGMPMEALSIRLDGMETLNASPKASFGAESFKSGESTFSLVLDNVLKATDGVQKPVELTKPQEKQPESTTRDVSASADDSKLKQMVSESDKTEVTEASNKAAETENLNEETTTVSEAKETKEQKAVLAADNSEKAETEETLLLANSAEESAETVTVKKDSKDSLVKIVTESVFIQDESTEEVANSLSVQNELEELSEKTIKKTGKTNESASLFANIQAEKANNPAKIEETLASDVHVQSIVAKKQEAPLIEVIDERTQFGSDVEKSSGLVSNVAYDGNGTAEMTLNLAESQGQNVAQIQDGANVQESSKSSFASMLSTEIRNNAGEFVKTGLITLRDNKSGTINLVLHPEELGNVKIKLELSDKLITGRIIVSSEEAYGAFKNNIESLRQAFLNSGFESAGLELSWSGSDESNNRHNDSENGKNPHGFDYTDSMPLAAGAEDMPDGYFGLTSVNVVI